MTLSVVSIARLRLSGGNAENAGLKNAGLENAGPTKYGKPNVT